MTEPEIIYKSRSKRFVIYKLSVAHIFRFLWWNLTIRVSHRCSCSYFPEFILLFGDLTMSFVLWQTTIVINNEERVVIHESRSTNLVFRRCSQQGQDVYLFKGVSVYMYASVCVCSVIQSKNRHIIIMPINRVDDNKVPMTTELLLLVKYAFSKI